jgi:TolA-binding protein
MKQGYGIMAAALAGVLSAAAVQAQPVPERTDPRAAEYADRERQRAEREVERVERVERERIVERAQRLDEAYEDGQEALEEGRWQRAAERFAQVIAANGPRTDAAMYWRAYALDRMGQKADALTAVAELIKRYPSSRWLADARALEVQVRQSAGQAVSPEATGDEELKRSRRCSTRIPSRRCR